jgi:ribose transport system substrate-binding protein
MRLHRSRTRGLAVLLAVSLLAAGCNRGSTGDKHVLVGAVNDPSAVGALRAIQSAGRSADFLIGGQNASIEARQEICNNSATFVGTVGYFPEKYGEKLVELAKRLHRGEKVDGDVYIDHLWVSNANIRQFYPNC